MLKRRLLTIFALLLVLSPLLAGSIRPASAHALLLRTDPADGTILSEAPRQIKLWFSQAVVTDFTRLELVDGEGKHSLLQFRRDDSETDKFAQEVVLVASLPDLLPNTYRVSWESRSEDDLHPISGFFVFGLQRAVISSGTEQVAPAPQPFEVISRWLGFAGLSGLVGALALAFVMLKERDNSALAGALRLRLLGLGFWSALLGFGAGLAFLLAQSLAGDLGEGAWWSILTRTGYGTRWILAQGFLLLLVAGFWLWRRQTRRETPFNKTGALVSLLPLTLALVGVQALNSHSGGVDGVTLLTVTVDILHLLAAGFWAGGLVALALAVAPLLRKGPSETELAWALLRRFGMFAALCVVILAATGLYKSGQQVASLDALLVTLYGQALMFKVELALFAGVVGLLNAALLHPRVGNWLRRALFRRAGWQPFAPRHLGRALLVEALAATGVLLLAALISTAQPARGPEFDPPTAESATPTITKPVADLLVTLTVKPNRPGQNFLTLAVYNTRRPAPAPVERVAVRLQPAGERQNEVILTAEPLGNNRYQISSDRITTAGDWNLNLEISRPGLSLATLSVPWRVLPEEVTNRRPILFSNQPLAPILTPLAIALALLGGGLLLVLGLGRPRETRRDWLRILLLGHKRQTQRRE